MPIGTIEVPATHVTDEPTICIPVNVDWIPALLAMVSPARYPEFWAGVLDENRRARLEVQNLINLIATGGLCNMTICCVPPNIIKRVDPATGMLQQSSDGGSTWQPLNGGFITQIVEPIPPVTNGVASTKCDATQNIQNQILGWITHVTNDFDTAVDIFAFGSAVIAAIADAVLLILSAGTLTLVEAEIITAIGAAITGAWLAGKTIFSNYWTDAVKKQIKCAILAHIGDDGSFTDDQFNALWNSLNSGLPGGVAKAIFMGFMSSVGKRGFNAMAASGTASGTDCSDCTCIDCPVEWTFFGVTDVVKLNDCHYTMTRDTSLGHFAFTSGDETQGCYFNWTGLGAITTWPVGSTGSSPVDPNTTAIWNFDTATIDNGAPMDVVFSGGPF